MAVTKVGPGSLASILVAVVAGDVATGQPADTQATDGKAEDPWTAIAQALTDARAAVDTATGGAGPKKFSSQEPFAYQQAVQYVTKTFFEGKTGNTSLIGSFVNAWAERLGDTTVDDTGKITAIRYPSFQDLVAQPSFQSGAAMLPYAGVIPENAYVIDDTGTKITRMTYDPMVGVKQETFPYDPKALFGDQTPGQFDLRSPQDNLPAGLLERLDPQTQAALTGQAVITNAKGQKVNVGHPLMTMKDYLNILQPNEKPKKSGAAGPRIDFDRRKLAEQARQMWGAWLFDAPSDSTINQIVDRYVSEATGFWRRGGGSLDYKAFLAEQLRKQPRYQTIFHDKPVDVPEDQFIASYARPVAALGLRPEETRRETVTALGSGGSPLGQLRRISGTRQGMEATNFSRRFAATLQGLGQGART